MGSITKITIHASQFPESVRKDLVESLRSRKVNHKFHYDSIKQAQKWLALHEAYSPARRDPDCVASYERSFAAIGQRLPPGPVHLFGLGCGGGQKDLQLLKRLRAQGRETFYTPCDVSSAMVLTARQTCLEAVAEENCFPFVCDLATAEDLPAILDTLTVPNATRLLTFFGMLPNFESQKILPSLAALVRPGHALLVSANLAPGEDYREGLKRILPLYDNELTSDWLMTFLFDLSVERADGELSFVIEQDEKDKRLERVAAYFRFNRERLLRVESEEFRFGAGDSVRLFFSYRHTPTLLGNLLQQHRLQIVEQWVTASEEEGVFLVNRLPSS